jgi:arsenite methyltransferase
MKQEEITKSVRDNYARVAKESGSSCCGNKKSSAKSSCCGQGSLTPDKISKAVGYSEADINQVPDGANLGLGCGNPVALASLKTGEVVLDLGSGAGFDCFLASARVGPQGQVIGVDMTPEMLDKARANSRKGNYQNVEFRLGEIENLPVGDNSVDAIISNCVINLSPDKPRVFREAFRVLKAGGRLMVSDIVLTKALPDALKDSIEAYVSCVAGASPREEYLQAMRDAGFTDVKVITETTFPLENFVEDPVAKNMMKDSKINKSQVEELASAIVSVKVSALKK